MVESERPWDALSRATADYRFTLYCTNMRPHCGHGTMLDVESTIAKVGDRTWRWVRRRARCTVCNHYGATIIMSPVWSGPPDLKPG